MNNIDCEIYKKHHNIIDGIYMLRMPKHWEDIPNIDEIDAEDEDDELLGLFKDINIYDIEDLNELKLPTDNHNIKETIFIIRRNGEYFLCETQGVKFIKFSINISNIDFVEVFDRMVKLVKLQEVTNHK